MDERLSRWLLLPPLLALFFLLVLYQYACPGAPPPPPPPSPSSPCPPRFSSPDPDPQHHHASAPPLPGSLGGKFPFGLSELCRRLRFDMRGRDVMVFLHIQKTGGTTFGRHLVRNIHLERPCHCRAGQKKCTCQRPGAAPAEESGGGTVGTDKGDTWLFSRFSTGWSCGLHADWTELTSCVPAAMERRGGCLANRTLSLLHI
uniref:Uncharacterized protein n=1 Tax=Sphaerodactylus townsendi TaxID=933632 RepID=A0ACB8FK45_9SAUR